MGLKKFRKTRAEKEPYVNVSVLGAEASKEKAGSEILQSEILQKEIYCHECSKAGGARMPIYHLPPACKPQ